MPAILDYRFVLDELRMRGLKCHYYNSGAFGFARDQTTTSRGWIGPADGSIREEARALVRQVDPPYPEKLTALLLQARQELLPGPVWVMPKSHWAFELDYGSGGWMPGLLTAIGLRPESLSGLNMASAIQFLDDEDDGLEMFVRGLLTQLRGSDFMLVFPDRSTICTVHSHVQLWWTTADDAVAAGLERLLPGV